MKIILNKQERVIFYVLLITLFLITTFIAGARTTPQITRTITTRLFVPNEEPEPKPEYKETNERKCIRIKNDWENETIPTIYCLIEEGMI